MCEFKSICCGTCESKIQCRERSSNAYPNKTCDLKCLWIPEKGFGPIVAKPKKFPICKGVSVAIHALCHQCAWPEVSPGQQDILCLHLYDGFYRHYSSGPSTYRYDRDDMLLEILKDVIPLIRRGFGNSKIGTLWCRHLPPSDQETALQLVKAVDEWKGKSFSSSFYWNRQLYPNVSNSSKQG